MSHDPERNAAAYLGGDMSRRHRRAFESHIIDCEDCWQEVEVGRTGRSVAESGRELAPQFLRERVRAAVETLETRRHRRRWLLGAGGALMLVAFVVVVQLRADEQPRVIAAIVADFEAGSISGTGAPPSLPPKVGDLRLRGAHVSELAGTDVVVHVYADPAGHRVSVYQGEATFPIAEAAEHVGDGDHWTAEVDGVVLWCSDEPVPSLVVGDDDREVALAATELGLR